EEGYKGEFFEPDNTDSLANAIEKILVNDPHRIHLGKTNYEAACSLPMSTITQMYTDYFKAIKHKNLPYFSPNFTTEKKTLREEV
ncbi:glycosyltransferase, partial [Muriicola sp.]|uniref:glycosyltransferase n=1 Tax=Muriicola sp. TaxID=2020856 RepID=UPI003C77D3B3